MLAGHCQASGRVFPLLRQLPIGFLCPIPRMQVGLGDAERDGIDIDHATDAGFAVTVSVEVRRATFGLHGPGADI
jgi:hypothetical protein